MQLGKRPSRAEQPGNSRSGIAERTENAVVWWGGDCLNASEGVGREKVKEGDEYQTAEGEELLVGWHFCEDKYGVLCVVGRGAPGC